MPNEQGKPQATPATGPANDEPAVVTLSAAEVERFRALEAAEVTRAAEFAALKAADEAKEKRIAEMERKEQQARFTAEVRGKSDANGIPWAPMGSVDHEGHIAQLTALANQFGEESPEFTRYVELNRAVAADRQKLLSATPGSGRTPDAGSDAETEADQKAHAYAAQHKTTYHQAYEAVLASDRELAARLAAPKGR